jgi:lipoprotein signal peptidase
MPPESQYWFRAKRYGYGWGLPLRWQGWAVLVAFFVLLAAGNLWLLTFRHSPGFFLAYLVILCGALFGVCYAKGEPPQWRWGR